MEKRSPYILKDLFYAKHSSFMKFTL